MGDAVLSKEASLARLAAAQAAKAAADALAGGPLGQVEQHRNWPLLSQLPLKLNVAVTMPGFKVRDLLALGAGQTIASLWKVSEDVPLRVSGVEFGWGEFEVIEQKLALRMTRLG